MSLQSVRAVGELVIVLPDDPREMIGKLYLPQKYNRAGYHTATVLSIGPKVYGLEVGNRILIEGTVTGQKLPDSDQVVIHQDCVIAEIGKETEIE